MTDITTSRRGIRLDDAQLTRQLWIRGITARQLAEAAGVSEVILSRARHGQPITARTFQKLTAALVSIPTVKGADLVLAAPEGAAPPAA